MLIEMFLGPLRQRSFRKNIIMPNLINAIEYQYDP